MAKTYCEWADRRLLTEAEWEKVARGTNGNLYPWGNDVPNNNLLNFNTLVGDTTEVGTYPNGVSIYGAYDMAGNVLEWVSSLYKSYPYNSADGREDSTSLGTRVLRGGSWVSNNGLVRSSNRSGNDRSYAINSYGFRCAMSISE
jgi:formylglycine-generating enzyme required for sulfatase activity